MKLATKNIKVFAMFSCSLCKSIGNLGKIMLMYECCLVMFSRTK